MPRSGVLGTATPPAGTVPKNPNDIIPSAAWNALFQDIYQIFNTETPEAYGGTNASSFTEARENLKIDWEVIDVVSVSNVPNYTKTDLADFVELKIEGILIPTGTEYPIIRLSTDNGSSFYSATTHQRGYTFGTVAGANVGGVSNETGFIPFFGALASDANFGGIYLGPMMMVDFNKPRGTRWTASCEFYTPGPFIGAGSTGGNDGKNLANNALRITMSSGNIASARFTLSGKRG